VTKKKTKVEPIVKNILIAIDEKNYKEAIKLIENIKEKAQLIEWRNKAGGTLLHSALKKKANIGVYNKIIEKGIDLNVIDENGDTVLHWAVFHKLGDICKKLIPRMSKKAINAKDDESKTALHWACQNKLEDVGTLLINNKKFIAINLQDDDGKTALHWACQKKLTVKLCKSLILEMSTKDFNLRDNEGNTALIFAVFQGLSKVSKLLIKKMDSKGLNIQDDDGETALIYAIKKGLVSLCKRLIPRMSEEAINAKDNKDGNTALHFAALNGDIELVEFLIAKKADVNARNTEGTNPLGMAFLGKNSEGNITKIAELFIKKKTFNVNEHLNNKSGMDYEDNGGLTSIGGFNILHMALSQGNYKILNILGQRNKDTLDITNSECLVNFNYPSLNPKHHMNSPIKLLELLINDKKQLTQLQELLRELQNLSNGYEDNSGDSSDESAPAYMYKQAMLNLIKANNKILNLTKEKQKQPIGLDEKLNFSIQGELHKKSRDFYRKAVKTKALNDKEFKERMEEIEVKTYKTDTAKKAQETLAHKKAIERVGNDKKTKLKIEKSIKIKLKKLEKELNKQEENITENLEGQAGKKLLTHHESIVIPHFHGVPFMKGQYTNHEKRKVAANFFNFNQKMINKEEDESLNKSGASNIIHGLHSRTSTASNGIENLYHLINASNKELEALKKTDEILKRYLTNCYNLDSSQFLEAICTYVYDFSNDPWKFKVYNEKHNPITNFWDKLLESKITSASDLLPDEDRNNLDNIIKYRFPLLSLSKTPKHPVEFALGNRVETQSKGEFPTTAEYNNKGFPKHRLAGLLFITLHSVSEIDFMEERNELVDMCKLLKAGKLKNNNGDDKKASRIDNQAEVTFFGGVDEENVSLVIPLLYPNFSKHFRKGYHDDIWGLTKETYDNLKEEIKKDHNVDITKDIVGGLINFVKQSCIAISLSLKTKPYYYTPINKIKPWAENINVESVHKDIMGYIRSGQGEDSKKLEEKITYDSMCKFISSLQYGYDDISTSGDCSSDN